MITIERTVDISKPVQTETLRGNEFKLEANAHTFRISVANNGAAVALTGSVSASMLLADGSGLTLGGSLDNGVAVLTLPQAAYGVPGRFMLAIYSVQTGATEAETVKTCIYACVGAVVNTYGEQQYDPGNLIPDAETLAAYIEACQTATAAANTAAGRAETAALTAVTYAEQTGKTDAEKAQARTNIGAASEAVETAMADHFPATGKLVAGISTTASANGAVATGVSTTASGRASHAEGQLTTADGQVAHAEGYGTTASGDYSHAEGFGTKASGDHQHAFGKYNVEDTNDTYLEIAGNGTGDNARSNARTLDWNGNEALAGDLTVNKGGAGEMAVGSELSSLKSAFSILDEGLRTKETYTKTLLADYLVYDGQLIHASADFYGFSVSSALATSPGAKLFKIPCKGKKVVSYPVFRTSVDYGSVFADADDKIVSGYYNLSSGGLETGTVYDLNVPSNAKYFYASIPSSLYSGDSWNVTVYGVSSSMFNCSEIELPPVDINTVNAMIACGYTYVEACRNGDLEYGDVPAGSAIASGKINCSTFVRQLLQGIPYNDYLTGSTSGTSSSGKRWRFGYRAVGEDFFASNGTYTSQQIYTLYNKIGRACPCDSNMTGAKPGDIIVFGTGSSATVNNIKHIAMYVGCDAVGNHYLFDAAVYDTNGYSVGVRRFTGNRHTAVGIIRPNLSVKEYPITLLNSTKGENGISFNAKKGYAYFVAIDCKVTASTSVTITGVGTYTPVYSGIDHHVVVFIPSTEGEGQISISGVSDYKYNISYYIIGNAEQFDLFDIETKVQLLYGKTYSKQEAPDAFPKLSTDYLYLLTGITPGVSKLSDIFEGRSPGSYALKIDLSNIKTITYPVFKSSSNYGSFIFDSEDTVLWMYSETTENTGTLKTIDVPKNASYMLLSISNSLASIDWNVTICAVKQGGDISGNPRATPFEKVDRNMCLAGIKTDILTNKIPYHRGYLFHSLLSGDYSLWYGEDFHNIQKIGDAIYDPRLMRFAISPKDGRIIACQRDTRNGIWVWDGDEFTQLNNFALNPMAWLYNSGVDFIIDENNVEHCIFAEYSGSPTDGTVYNVWRGTYPYTSQSDWEIVMTQSYPGIMHFHQVRRDPWSNVLYLTCGDNDGQNKWWYSVDYGATWTLLVSDNVAGWGNQILRTINFIFTSDYIYWAIDHGENTHALYKIQRNSQNNIIDLSTKAKVTDLDGLKATNSLCYVETPNGLFMYDRVDTVPLSEYGKPITMKFWSFDAEELLDVVTLGLTSDTWGGSRGKCYINYTNSKQPMPAMGFSIDTPCIFDLVCDNPAKIGTIAYDVGSKTVRTIDY